MPRFSPRILNQVLADLTDLRRQAITMEAAFVADTEAVSPEYRCSAINLLHYLGLRQNDIRAMQLVLASLGLSSLGRCEAYTLADIDAVIAALQCMLNAPPPSPVAPPLVDFVSGPVLLHDHTRTLLGPQPAGRVVRIMVTMPGEAGTDYPLVDDLVAAGMDIMRINCAHDTIDDWQGMVENLRRAQRELGRECRILIDLAGPKLRTGALAPGPQVVRWRPSRDVCGIALAPSRIWLTPTEAPEPSPATPDAVLHLPRNLLAKCKLNDTLYAWDCEGVRRALKIVRVVGNSCWVENDKTVYLAAGARVELYRAKRKLARAHLGPLPPVIQPLLLHRGDTLLLTTEAEIGHGPTPAVDGAPPQPAQIPCTLPQVFADVRPGERIFFDDGKIGGMIHTVSPERLEISITYAQEQGTKLRPDKGINLPDSTVRLPALT